MNTEQKINWAILVTGWGRNAKDTIEAFNDQKFKKSKISLVVYEEEPCGAAEIAEETGIETLQLFKKDFSNLGTYQIKLIEELKNRKIDYVFMLNYKYIIKQDMLSAFPDRIINIHPSIFPSFLGTKTAIQDALEYGVRITGITTHIIDDKLDEGIILCQTPIKVKKEDTFDTLYPKFAKKGKKIIINTIRLIEELHFQ
ncbi:phosphoribosylglycinamide formyltransferase-1 [Aquimarina sp. MAR_2010_214]|uniref:formyltransferase family protein n=1 Tax=Aquimarina sp. MAR_2010_214 TaxID=1250026 RepID=UPI000C70CBB4|nr:formyltransferase family protein [Aquimarina sp. MAR_2010_214]PKV50990.1 phosphoribosylglycinamide formyltransferase-1 [Aquimarina sp. MAR_2010_214]